MAQKVFFSEKSIKEMERSARNMVLNGGDKSPEDLCFIRFARDIAPLYMRAVAEEVNRDTPLNIAHSGSNKLIAWMIAQKASACAPEARLDVIALFARDIAIQAMEMAEGQDPPEQLEKIAVGEVIKGHA